VVEKAVGVQADKERNLLSALKPEELQRLNALLRKLILAIEAVQEPVAGPL
jgi:hypothetical protein